MKILVGLSGGVDSSVTLRYLLEQNFEVAGATMSLWHPGKYQGGTRDACFGPGEKADIAYARELCAQLQVPYYLFDCAEEYEKIVLDDFRREYLAGRTPNPCVRCNSRLKFGLLPQLARQQGVTFDRFATGHYARVERVAGRSQLLRPRDRRKDQTYFLYRLTPEQLDNICFPLGNLTKLEVRALAEKYQLAVSHKPDSQDFYSGDPAELLQTPERPGDIVDVSGRKLGTHCGYWHFTIGQRRGLGVAAPRPLYVVALNACRNQVVVSDICPRHHELTARELNWCSIEPPLAPFEAAVKVRSAGEPVPCRVMPQSDGTVACEIPEGILAISAGQSAVFYQADLVLGGGIISQAR